MEWLLLAVLSSSSTQEWEVLRAMNTVSINIGGLPGLAEVAAAQVTMAMCGMRIRGRCGTPE